MSKRTTSLTDLLMIAVGVAFMCYGQVKSSRLPHHITVKLGTKTISDYWTTNNENVTWQDGGVLGSPFGDVHPVTNYLWKKY